MHLAIFKRRHNRIVSTLVSQSCRVPRDWLLFTVALEMSGLLQPDSMHSILNCSRTWRISNPILRRLIGPHRCFGEGEVNQGTCSCCSSVAEALSSRATTQRRRSSFALTQRDDTLNGSYVSQCLKDVPAKPENPQAVPWPISFGLQCGHRLNVSCRAGSTLRPSRLRSRPKTPPSRRAVLAKAARCLSSATMRRR
jgi:hypothetical protein